MKEVRRMFLDGEHGWAFGQQRLFFCDDAIDEAARGDGELAWLAKLHLDECSPMGNFNVWHAGGRFSAQWDGFVYMFDVSPVAIAAVLGKAIQRTQAVRV
jgi:hypothetical protein